MYVSQKKSSKALRIYDSIYNQFQNHAVSGFLSGSLVSLLTTPSDIVKCTIQNEKSKHWLYHW